MKQPVEFPADVPFSVSLTTDTYEPWTDTGHKYRFFKQPILSKIEPAEIDVGQLAEVYVSIDPETTGSSNIFFEPIPAAMQQFSHDSGDDVGPTLAQFSYILCGFGRFGETRAVYLNETHIKCMTPSVTEDPEDIYKEQVNFQVSMNGFDFEDADASITFTFNGKATSTGMVMYVILILLLGVLAAALIVYF